MHIVSLHPIDLATVRRYVATLNGEPPDPAWGGALPGGLRDDASRARAGDERAATRLTYGLASALGRSMPVFTHGNAFGLSFWEAQVDRPMGMLMRPPARLFMDAGLDAVTSRAMPTRLDFQMGMMGGAYIPARLIDQAYQLLDEHMERTVKRLMAAEYDPIASLGLMCEAVSYARGNGLGLYEAMDVTGPDGDGLPGATVFRPDRNRLDRDLVQRIIACQQPPKSPGLFQRMFGRGGSPANPNGRLPEGER